MRGGVVALLMVLLFRISADGQTGSYSPYSIFGVGLLKTRASVHNRALAETGIGLRDAVNLNTMNPASYTAINSINQIAEFGFFAEQNSSETTDQVTSSNAGGISSVNFWLKPTKRWGAAIGIAPYSVVNYNIITERDFTNAPGSSVKHIGSGGLTQVYIGNGFDLTKNLSVGFTATYVLGNIRRNETVTTGRFADLTFEDKVSIHKASLDFGLQYEFSFKNGKSLTLGSTFANSREVNPKREIQITNSSGDSLSLEDKNIRNYILPNQMGFGASFQSTRHTFASDLTLKDWGSGKLGENLTLRNVWRVSAAYEFKGSPVSESYLDQVNLRAGFYLQQNPMVIKQTKFTDWGCTIGLGLPVNRFLGMVNLSYSLAFSGTMANDLILQRSNIFSIGIISRDWWGMKRKFD